MKTLVMRRIDLGNAGGRADLDSLMALLGNSGNVVSAKGRELTRQVFGRELTPAEVVDRVCEDVRTKGLEAVLHYTKMFDGFDLEEETIQVSHAEMRMAHAAASPKFLDSVRRIKQNILAFQSGLIQRDAELSLGRRGSLKLRVRPLKRVGFHIPGGAAAYPSTLLMTVAPARAAGVKELVVTLPPTKHGAFCPDMLAVCQELGVDEVYRIGGAQAIAAMAYGVRGVKAVDMIVGPGNLFVALAKKKVFGQVAIDCIAGPSEVVVLADQTANPKFLAAELIAQAEHSPGSSLLVTWKKEILDEVERELNLQLVNLERGELARDCLEQFGALVSAPTEAEALECVERLAPEHLHIATACPESQAEKIDSVGAIFLGEYSPVAAGDYAAGPSHVLPTGGTARFSSGLTSNDFLRRSSVISLTREGLEHLAPDICSLADREGLTGHKASVLFRLEKKSRSTNRD
ncbi:MAG: histidinol dehydrogenase [Gemmataceae bacterium]|nr:histidinol dehydrogenase [Gemmataceae bacterium]